MQSSSETTAKSLFLHRFLAHPGRVFSIVPSSRSLSRVVAQQIHRAEDEYVVELGAGTGSVTEAILASGVPADKLIAVEIDHEMAEYLRECFPGITVLECCASEIDRHLPQAAQGRIGAVVCGIPIGRLPLHEQRQLTDAMLSMLPPGRPFLLFTFRWVSPLPLKKLGLVARKLRVTMRNFPPASVWAFAGADGAASRDDIDVGERESAA